MKRIYSIDCLKLYFAFVIAFSHYGINLPGAAFAVKLFFVISGFFLAKKFYSKSYINNDVFTFQKRYNYKQYTFDHIKHLFPHYIFSFIVILMYTLYQFILPILSGNNVISNCYNVFKTIYKFIPEVFLLQSAGFVEQTLNYPAWQICAILICGYFIYALMYYSEKLSTEIAFPLVIIFFETYWIVGRDPFANLVFIPATLARGFAMMALGVITYKISCSAVYDTVRHKSVFYNLFSLFIIAGMFLFDRYNGVHIIGFVILILYLYDENSWANIIFNRKIFKNFGNLSYAIYLNHALIIDVIRNAFKHLNIADNSFTSIFIFAAVLTIYSLITLKIVDKLKKIIAKT